MKAFISYSHQDAEHLDRLHEHLATLRRQGHLDAWTDRDICAGEVIDEQVAANLHNSEIYLLLVSSAFLNSNYCYEKEFLVALDRFKAGKAVIVPLIIRECDWGIPALRQFKALPRDGKPVISRHWHTPDEAYADIATGLRFLIDEIESRELSRKKRAKDKDDDFLPDSSHVSPEQRAELRKIGEEIVARLTAWAATKPDADVRKIQGRWYGTVWKQFHDEFGTSKHGLKSLPVAKYEAARSWLVQYRASKDDKLKRANPQMYRTTLTKTIYTLAGTLGWTKEQLYDFATERIGYTSRISSLNDLGNTQLKTVRDRIRYEATRRGVKSAQARVRRGKRNGTTNAIVSGARSVANIDVLRIDNIKDIHRTFLDMLKADEFAELVRLGEYGRTVPSAARKGSQPDGLAPNKRISAFYTYCAYEYFYLSSFDTYDKDRLRIEDFVRRKLSPEWAYYLTRGDDGYVIGAPSAAPYSDLNFRHTMALGLTLTLAGNDGHAIDALRSRVLEGGAQAPNGGWAIWGSDGGKSDRTDPIATGYAILLLQEFARFPLSPPEKDRIQVMLKRSADYLMGIFSPTDGVWVVPKNSAIESTQMACWYYDVLNGIPHIVPTESIAPVIVALEQKVQDNSFLNMLRISEIGDDVLLRAAITLLGESQDPRNAQRAGANALVNALRDHLKLRGLTTYSITRILLLLESMMKVGPRFSRLEIVGNAACALDRLLRGTQQD